MKKTTNTLIKYYFPSLLFSAEASEKVRSTNLPAKLPKNCFAFRFGKQNVVEDGSEIFEQPATWDKTIYIVGEKVPLKDIPDTESYSILRSNVQSNSPTKCAVKTYLGNWQNFDENTLVVAPKHFQFEERWV